MIETVDSVPEICRMDDCIYIPLQDGEYAGEDCRDVLAEAILWWDNYINDIDIEVI